MAAPPPPVLSAGRLILAGPFGVPAQLSTFMNYYARTLRQVQPAVQQNHDHLHVSTG
jgi:hypothetical protein